MKYRADIDGLRAVAVVPVILFHAGFSFFEGGYIGVDIFFVISGFLITSILLEDLSKNRFNLFTFYERRARRIIPALGFIAVLCIPFSLALMTPMQLKDFAQSLAAVALFVSNILFYFESDYFDTSAEEKPLLHTWSLAIEEQYYLIFPIILFFLYKFGKKAMLLSLGLIMFSSLLLAHITSQTSPVANFYLIQYRFWELLGGSLAAIALRYYTIKNNSTLSLLGLAMVLGSIVTFDQFTPFPSFYTLIPVVGTVLIILNGSSNSLVSKILSLKPVVFIGLISYSAYLWHQPIFAFTRIALIEEPAPVLMMMLSCLSLTCAFFTWKFVEEPFRKKNVFGREFIFKLTFFTLTIFIFWGVLGHISSGFKPLIPKNKALRAERLENLSEKRLELVEAGIYHYNGKGKFTDIDSLIQAWQKTPKVEGQPSVAVYGDSHAADKAAILRNAGYNVRQLTGAGCPLLPNDVKIAQRCTKLINTFMSELPNSTFEAIFIANRFSEHELEETYIKQIIDFWGSLEKPIILFSSMPEFNKFDYIFTQHGIDSSLYSYDSRLLIEEFKIFNTFTLPSNFYIINTERYFCANTDDNCLPFLDSAPLVVDYAHLSEHGINHMSKNLGTDLPQIIKKLQ